jgi:hypothetical protein
LLYGQIYVKIVTLMALAMMVFGPVAAATFWSSGSYGLEAGSVTWPTKEVSVQGVTKLGGAAGQAGPEDKTTSAVGLGNNSSQVGSQEEMAAAIFQLGNNSIQVASEEGAVAMVQLGSGGSSVSAQAPASGTVQLGGYYDNMGSYTNIFYPIKMLGGTFSSSGGGCGSCG